MQSSNDRAATPIVRASDSYRVRSYTRETVLYDRLFPSNEADATLACGVGIATFLGSVLRKGGDRKTSTKRIY